ncbi:MAG: hypothetical protein V4539_10625 [Bacteroidota bacterium]
MYLVVLDANVWIRFARDKNIKPLTTRLLAYKLVPVVDNYLLSEIFDALVDNHWMNQEQAMGVINFIKRISAIHIGQAVPLKS